MKVSWARAEGGASVWGPGPRPRPSLRSHSGWRGPRDAVFSIAQYIWCWPGPVPRSPSEPSSGGYHVHVCSVLILCSEA